MIARNGGLHLIMLLVTTLGATTASFSATAAKVEICHKEKKVIRVNERALPAHKAHGDFMGQCDEVHSARLLLSCAISAPEFAPAIHEVTAVTASEDITESVDLMAIAEGDCASALQAVNTADCKESHVFGTPQAQTYSYMCPSQDSEIP